MNPDERPGAGDQDEVVAAVADHDDARPLVESLLLAGLGPSVRETTDGVEVTVVAGQGRRAREVLGLAEEDPAPSAPPPPRRSLVNPFGPGPAAAPPGDAPVADRSSTARALVIFAVALVVIPAVAFYISFKVAGG